VWNLTSRVINGQTFRANQVALTIGTGRFSNHQYRVASFNYGKRFS
jgi:hypothetical protein